MWLGMLAPLSSAVLQTLTILVIEIILYSARRLYCGWYSSLLAAKRREASALALPSTCPWHFMSLNITTLFNIHLWTHSFVQASTHSLSFEVNHPVQIILTKHKYPLFASSCRTPSAAQPPAFKTIACSHAASFINKTRILWLHTTVHGGHPRLNTMRYTTLSANRADGVQWYWRIAAICAACLILGGFLVVPSTFDTQPQLRVSQTILGGFGIGLLALGFSLAALASFCSRSWAFSAEHIFVPCIFACLIGFLNVLYCFSISTRFKWNVTAMTTTIGAAVAAFVFTVLYFFARRRLARPQHEQNVLPDHIDLLRRPSNASAAGSYHTQSYFANHFANMYPAARTSPPNVAVTPPNELPVNDTEMQRRRMSDLLHKPEPHISPATSPFNRIDFNLDETETPVHGYYAPVATNNLSTRSFGNPAWHGRNESWTTNNQSRNSSREERRREIESGR
ncbi:hypothetical protein E4T39_08255 [Aureobasidium subglaciale]|nr:hypothetical protein E4T39_08255 [Aureobasidium subglaciale]